MRYGLIGDIHAQDGNLERSLRFLEGQDLAGIFCTGDFCDGVGSVDVCIEAARSNRFISVLGNHDQWFLHAELRTLPDATTPDMVSGASIEYLSSLECVRSFDVDGFTIVLCHGVLENTMAKVNPDDYGYALESNDALQRFLSASDFDMMINGHSHRRMVRSFGNKVIINAGSLCQDRRGSPCFSIIDFKQSLVEFYDLQDGGIHRGEKIEL